MAIYPNPVHEKQIMVFDQSPLAIEMKQHFPVFVTKPYLPPRDELITYIDQIIASRWLTNNGPLATNLNGKIAEKLDLTNFHWVNNGTLAIQVAIRAFNLSGSIITTPLSYVATANAIALEGCEPIFCDVDPNSFCIDPAKIEALIRPDTTAIIPVHVYGRPCDIESIERIAKKHNLRVIYDAAHAFGSIYKGKSLVAYGDASTLSFHATKVYHTVEGGGIHFSDVEFHNKAAYLFRHGHLGDTYYDVGHNGKNSEFHAAVGLAGLPYFDKCLHARKAIYEVYSKQFSNTDIAMYEDGDNKELVYNHAYAVLKMPSEKLLLKAMANLKGHDIIARRYFWPALHNLPQFKSSNDCPVADSCTEKLLCLPLYPDLPLEVADLVSKLVLETLEQ